MINARHYTPLQNRSQRYAKLAPVLAVSEFKIPVLMVILHIPLGLLLYSSSALALLHPLVVFFVGLYYAVRKQERLERVACVVAYLVGIEVLWRMADSSIYYEFGKYGTAAIMVAALATRGYWKIPTLPLIYLAFLIPACFFTLLNNNIDEARKLISSSLSGPFALFVSCWFFSYLKVTPGQLKKLLLTVAIPMISIAVATLFFTVTADEIRFTTESNFVTSGGFGPNQVSATLGLGVFACVACYLLFNNNFKETIFIGILATFLTIQSVMTFSRGGVYNAIGAIMVILFFQMRDLSQGVKRLLPVVGIGAIFLLLIFPYMNDFTGGKLEERFESSNTTNRIDIADSDLQIFYENPIMGIGVGESKDYRSVFYGKGASSHTEFSRILAEHGIFGIFSLIALGLAVIYNLRRQNSNMGKALVVGVVVWSSLFMLNAGMRLVAPSFMWGLCFLTIFAPQIRSKRVFNNFKNIKTNNLLGHY